MNKITGFFKISGSLFILFFIFACNGYKERKKAFPWGDEPILGFSTSIRFFRGESIYQKAKEQAKDMKELGANRVRYTIAWEGVNSTIESPLGITYADVTEEMVSKYISSDASSWQIFDQMITAYASENISLILVIAPGYSSSLPLYNGERATPDVLGEEEYLTQVFLYARATVRRYKKYAKIWQIENELNVACETVLWGWRDGYNWCDRNFTTRLMKVLYLAVKTEDPSALTTHNFHTDLHWIKDVENWYDYVDIIGLDAYPNYLNGKYPMGEIVGKRVLMAIHYFPDKPVIVLETGYPTQPVEKGFSEEGQAEYIKEAMLSTFLNGGSGFLYFTFITSEEPNQQFLQDVEPFWGLYRYDGSKKEGWYSYQENANYIKNNNFFR